jgi:hypothetical protein
MHDLFSGRDCFLADPEWQSLGSFSNVSIAEPNQNWKQIGDDYYRLLARLSSTTHQGVELRDTQRAGSKLDIAKVMRLIEGTARLHADFIEWYNKMIPFAPYPDEVPTEAPTESIFPAVLKYKDPWSK